MSKANFAIKISGKGLVGKRGSDIVAATNRILGVTNKSAPNEFRAVSASDDRLSFAFVNFLSMNAAQHALFKIGEGIELFPSVIIQAKLKGVDSAPSAGSKQSKLFKRELRLIFLPLKKLIVRRLIRMQVHLGYIRQVPWHQQNLPELA